MTQQEAHRIAISGLRFNLNNITKRLNVTTNPLKWIDGINEQNGGAFNINLQYNNGNYTISAPDLLDLLNWIDCEALVDEGELCDDLSIILLFNTVDKISQRYLAVA